MRARSGNTMKKLLIVWGNWGPYHHARFRALHEAAPERGFHAEGLELFQSSGIYAWRSPDDTVPIHHLDVGRHEMEFHPWQLTRQLLPFLVRLKPDVVLVPSYWHWSLYLNIASRLLGARIVMMNESHAGTQKARGWKLTLKRLIVSNFHAGLVGGEPHRRHYANLGLPSDLIFTGYDSVDNDHFSKAADAARADADKMRRRLGLPKNFFLSLGRLVEEKNLGALVEAFALVDQQPGPEAHHLVFVGSGPVERDLWALAQQRGLPVIYHATGREGETRYDAHLPSVHFYGFRQVEQNPTFYALAKAFVLPSFAEPWGLVVNEAMACGLGVIVAATAGCAEDLVKPGENGFLFPPESPIDLAERLRLFVRTPEIAQKFGEASRRIIGRWGCDNFARNALNAAARALDQALPENPAGMLATTPPPRAVA